MSQITITLHETLIRAAKMMIAGWEKWLKETSNKK